MLYSPIIKLIGEFVGNLKNVKGIYVRGSLSRGDGIPGRSDIDLTILIEEIENGKEEAELLYQLYWRYKFLKRIFPLMGEWEIFDEKELYSFHLKKTDRSYLVRYWGKIKGKIPSFGITKVEREDILTRMSWWICEILPHAYRKGNLHALLNAFLEIYVLCEYLEGKPVEPFPSRNEVLVRLIQEKREKELIELFFLRKRSYLFIDRGNKEKLARWLYRKTLQRILEKREKIFPLEFSNLKSRVINSFKPFQYLLQKYYLVSCEEDFLYVERNFIPIPEALFLSYLQFLSPWEIESVKKYNPGIIKISSTPYIKRYLRTGGIIKDLRYHIFRFPSATLFLYLQLRLYLEKGFVASDLKELVREYNRHFSDYEFLSSLKGKNLLLKGYPLMRDTLKELLKSSQNI